MHYDRRVRLRALVTVSFALLCILAPAVSATAAPTTVRLSVVGMPRTATAGTPFTLTVKATDTGPLAAGGLTIQVGVSKITGLGAKPGLILGPWMKLTKHIAQLGAGKSRTVVFHVLIPRTPTKGLIGTLGAAFVGPGGYWVGPSLAVRSPTGTKWTGAGTKNADVVNISLS